MKESAIYCCMRNICIASSFLLIQIYIQIMIETLLRVSRNRLATHKTNGIDSNDIWFRVKLCNNVWKCRTSRRDGHCPIAISAFNWMSFCGLKDKLQTF